MKKLLVLTVAAVLTANATGCWHWFNRGAQCGTPCASPCGPQATYGGAYVAPPAVGGAEYAVPGPG